MPAAPITTATSPQQASDLQAETERLERLFAETGLADLLADLERSTATPSPVARAAQAAHSPINHPAGTKPNSQRLRGIGADAAHDPSSIKVGAPFAAPSLTTNHKTPTQPKRVNLEGLSPAELTRIAAAGNASHLLSVHIPDKLVNDAIARREGPERAVQDWYDDTIGQWFRTHKLTVGFIRAAGITPFSSRTSEGSLNPRHGVHGHFILTLKGLSSDDLEAFKRFLSRTANKLEKCAAHDVGRAPRAPWGKGHVTRDGCGVPCHLKPIDDLPGAVTYALQHVGLAESVLSGMMLGVRKHSRAPRPIFVSSTMKKLASEVYLTPPASAGTIASPITKKDTAHAESLHTAQTDSATSSTPASPEGVQYKPGELCVAHRRELDLALPELHEPAEHHPSGTRQSERRHRPLRSGNRVGELVARQPASGSGPVSRRSSRSRFLHDDDDTYGNPAPPYVSPACRPLPQG